MERLQHLHQQQLQHMPRWLRTTTQQLVNQVQQVEHTPLTTAVAALEHHSLPIKKKRGRPRKYPLQLPAAACAANDNVMSPAASRKVPQLNVEDDDSHTVPDELSDSSDADMPMNDELPGWDDADTALYVPDAFDDNSNFNCNNRDRSNVERFHARTAGVMFAIKPCGTIVWWEEMFHCESLTHVALMLNFHYSSSTTTLQHRPAIIAYDRACQFEPVVKKLLQYGYLDERVWGNYHHYCMDEREKQRALHQQHKRSQPVVSAPLFMVDRFHIKGHTESTCDLTKLEVRYHPHMNKFQERFPNGQPNDEICEQTFRWLGKYAHMVKHMTRARFNMFIHIMVKMRNDIVQCRQTQCMQVTVA